MADYSTKTEKAKKKKDYGIIKKIFESVSD